MAPVSRTAPWMPTQITVWHGTGPSFAPGFMLANGRIEESA